MKTTTVTATLSYEELHEALLDYLEKKCPHQVEQIAIQAYGETRLVIEMYPGGCIEWLGWQGRHKVKGTPT